MSENDKDVEAHAQGYNINEEVVEDDAEVEGHGGGIQSNETVVEDADEKLADLEVPAEQADAVKGGMSEMGEMESL